MFPAAFQQIAAREASTGLTIQRHASIVELADRGQVYAAALSEPELLAQAGSAAWTGSIFSRPWRLPAGAFGEAAGPS